MLAAAVWAKPIWILLCDYIIRLWNIMLLHYHITILLHYHIVLARLLLGRLGS